MKNETIDMNKGGSTRCVWVLEHPLTSINFLYICTKNLQKMDIQYIVAPIEQKH